MEPGKGFRLHQGVDLLTQGHVLEQEVTARAAKGSNAVEHDGQHEVQGLHGANADADAAVVSREQGLSIALRSLVVSRPEMPSTFRQYRFWRTTAAVDVTLARAEEHRWR